MKSEKPLQNLDAYPDVDIHVAMRLSQCVDRLSLTPAEVAARTGIAASQVTAFLSGTVRIPASALFALAKALDVTVYFFFDRNTAEAVL